MSLTNPFERRSAMAMVGNTAPFIMSGGTFIPNELVSAEEALKNSDLYSVASLISSDIAGAKFIGDNSFTEMLNKPSDRVNRVTFWQTAVLSLLFNGNVFLIIDRVNQRLRFVPAESVAMELNGDELTYIVNQFGEFVGGEFSPNDIIHARIMAYGADELRSLIGHSPLESLANELAQQKQANRLTVSTLKGAINPTSKITIPQGTLTEEAKEAVRREFERANTGDNAGRVMVLDQSADFTTISINADIAKYLTSMDWGREQIAKAFGVPDSYLNGTGDQQSSLDQISALYVGGLNRYIEPLLSELNFKLGSGIKLDMSQIIDYSNSTLKADVLNWVDRNMMSAQEAMVLLQRKGVI